VQVDPIKPKVKPPGTKRLKLKCDVLLSTSAFKFNLRRYSVASLQRFVSMCVMFHLMGKRVADFWPAAGAYTRPLFG